MATFENTVTVRRAVEDVFAFLADFENVPTWNYAIVETAVAARLAEFAGLPVLPAGMVLTGATRPPGPRSR
jgi:hypothetical protein